MASVATQAFEGEIDRLRSLGLEELRREWRRLNHGEPPRISRDLLVRQSGKLYCHSELCDDLDILPDDIGDSEKFLQLPDKRELGLGKPLALDFARQFLPGDFDDVLQFFSRRGAYARFKDLLGRRGVLDQWDDFEAKAEESALRMWCDLNSIEVSD